MAVASGPVEEERTAREAAGAAARAEVVAALVSPGTAEIQVRVPAARNTSWRRLVGSGFRWAVPAVPVIPGVYRSTGPAGPLPAWPEGSAAEERVHRRAEVVAAGS